MKLEHAAVLAAITLVGGTAAAQSSVTIYGGIDLSTRSVTNGSSGKLRSLTSGSNTASRLGFSGTEDLGDGLSARFILESDIAADTGGAGSTSTTLATMTTNNTLVAGQSFKDNVLMGSYDFGIAKLYVARRTYTFMAEKMVQTVLNATALVGAFGLLKFAYAKADQTSAIGTSSADDATLLSLGYDYILSKRTRLYATVARVANSGNARYFIVGGPTSIGAGQTARGDQLGMRHTF